jgi:D-cysteine desulfhydrase
MTTIERILLLSLAWVGICPSILKAKLSEYETAILQRISYAQSLPASAWEELNQLTSRDLSERVVSLGTSRNALFRHYPGLAGHLSHITLGDFPTPVHHCAGLEQALGVPLNTIFMKHDGITGARDAAGKRGFGGNKMRKLQYLIADALAHGHRTVLTFGCVGSNHATQTAACAQLVGLNCICLLLPQPNAHVVQRNLLLQHVYGAEMLFAATPAERALLAAKSCYGYHTRWNSLPYVIPTGGSTPRGVIGYVEAAFELKEQIEAGLLPCPDHLYVTCGGLSSGGTAAGLLLGFTAAQLPITIHAVLDEPGDVVRTREKLQRLIKETNELICSYDPIFPHCTIAPDSYEIIDWASGTDYGEFTVEGIAAIELMEHTEGIQLDGVYTGKCFGALIDNLRSGKLAGATVLFWNTFCAESMAHITEAADYHALPAEFHRWFEEPVQPLDCGQ